MKLLTVILLITFPQLGYAFNCTPSSIEEMYREADLVAVVKAHSTTTLCHLAGDEGLCPGPEVSYFKIQTAYKSDGYVRRMGHEVGFYFVTGEFPNPTIDIKVGKHYLIFASHVNAGLYAPLTGCFDVKSTYFHRDIELVEQIANRKAQAKSP